MPSGRQLLVGLDDGTAVAKLRRLTTTESVTLTGATVTGGTFSGATLESPTINTPTTSVADADDHYEGTDLETILGEIPMGAMRKRITLIERFEQLPLLAASNIPADATGAITTLAEQAKFRRSNRNFYLFGTNAADAGCVFDGDGKMKLTCAGGAADQMIVAPDIVTSTTAWNHVLWSSNKETIWELVLKTDASIAVTTIWAGLKLTNPGPYSRSTDDDQVLFEFTPGGSANWRCIESIATVDTDTDSTVVVATSTRYHLRIAIASNRTAKMYINGSLVRTTAALTNAVNLVPSFGIQAAAARILYIEAQAISRVP